MILHAMCKQIVNNNLDHGCQAAVTLLIEDYRSKSSKMHYLKDFIFKSGILLFPHILSV